ncbi:peroxidase 21-like [Amaranthus tricolor]|uniref:peroxidase 21-like n=1 Tax=Amaranthus tricolor TaxID=29722 RepID=UPI002584B9E7|nr:peroxidase 21-like [Amaranthus tricolor]
MSIRCFLCSLLLLIQFYHVASDQLEVNFYSETCPNAETKIKEEVTKLYQKHGNTAVSWIRNLFHDCMVKSCDASILLDENKANGVQTEKTSQRNFGMRNFKYIDNIKEAIENECPSTVSCADIIALTARDAVELLGGPHIEMKTGRRDSLESHALEVEAYIPNFNDSMSFVLSRFQQIGVDTEATVALFGAHSVGRVHCVNIVNRLYPTTDPTLDPDYAEYLKRRCPTPIPDPNKVEYVRNDLETPMVLDNMYYKHLLNNQGLLLVDQELATHSSTLPFVQQMAADNGYFHDQFARAMLIMSENNPLTADQGDIRIVCSRLNSN